ncbi:MAG: DedA family protein [Gaiellales bacterium]
MRPADSARPRWGHVALVVAGVVVLAVVGTALLAIDIGGIDGFSLVDTGVGEWAYATVFLFVVGDALFPVLPGETVLNAASTLAAGGSLNLWLVMAAGALGAVVGDSALYWVARLGRRRMGPQLERAQQNDKVKMALDIMGANAALMIVAGRYVPGLRFAVNATMGISAFSYRRFLPWSILGGTVWSVYTCALAYLVGTALSGFPLASIVISGLLTTVAIGVIFVVVRRRRQAAAGQPA